MKWRLSAVGLFLMVTLLGTTAAQNPNLKPELDAAYQKGMTLHKGGRSAEALLFIEQAAMLAPKVFGPDHGNVGAISNAAGMINSASGRFRDAEKHFQRSVDIHQAIPNNNTSLLRALSNLGATQDQLGKFLDAEKNLKRAITIHEAMLPRDDLAYALTLNNYGSLLYRVGRYPEAEVYFKRCIELREAKLGKEHPFVADSVLNLAGVYRRMRRDQEAETLAMRALQMAKTAYGDEHASVARGLMELGLISFRLGRYQQAEKYFVETLRMREKLLGKGDPGIADCLDNLALVYVGIGRTSEAEALHRRALAMRESRYGPNSPQVANSLSNLAMLFVHLGRHDEAEKELLRSIQIKEEKTPNHPELAGTLSNLAGVYHHQGRHNDARIHYQRALEISETHFGKDHLNVCPPLNNLAVLYRQMSKPATALPMLQRALRIQEAHHGVGHPGTASTINNIAMVQWNLGKFEEADKLIEKSIDLQPGTQGDEGIYRGISLHTRAELNLAMGKPREAFRFETESLKLYDKELRNVFAFSSEADMHSFADLGNGRLPSVVCMALQYKDDDHATTLAFDWTLRLKGAVFDTICRFRQAQHHMQSDSALQDLAIRYRSQKETLANLALNPPAGKDAPRMREIVEKAQHEVVELETQLTRIVSKRMPDVGGGRDNITTDILRKRLPPNAALIEFSSTATRDFKRATWGPTHYVAFVLTPGQAAPRLIDLGPTKEIDASVETLRKEFTDFQEKLKDCDNEEEIAALEKTQEKQFASRSADLYTRLFAPLRKELGKATLLYLAPDGGLNRLPFETLVGPDGKYLIEHYRCAYVSNGRDLLRAPTTLAKGTVVFANPDFKLDADERLAQVEKLLPKKAISLALRGQTDRQLRSVGWKNLPGAAAEAKDIRKILGERTYGPVTTYVGGEAIEEVLKAMPAPRVLHLATHGFFLDREPDAKEPTEDGAGAGWARGRLKRMDNPLLRSGIVLAGANTVGDKDAAARVDDGWVTAEEIALLNLHGTELVVLSACQTGLGDLKTGEGVQGLRRAFLYAGAQTLLTSLFEVPDTETRELMNRFYSEFKTGRGKLHALHSAQRGFIDHRRKTHGAAHPFFWASFVLVGDPD